MIFQLEKSCREIAATQGALQANFAAACRDVSVRAWDAVPMPSLLVPGTGIDFTRPAGYFLNWCFICGNAADESSW
jgi:hypothetical protein